MEIARVETFSLLPQSQRNGCDLARECEPRHRRLHAFFQQSLVEVLERSGPYAGRDGGSFEQRLQIMVVVLVETPDGELLLGVP